MRIARARSSVSQEGDAVVANDFTSGGSGTSPFSDNPYRSPEVAVTTSRSPGTGDVDLSPVVIVLEQIRPWMRFLSVMTFICAALMLVLGFAIMALDGMGGPSAFAGVIYVVMAVLYFLPAMLLWTSANRIAAFGRQRTVRMLAHALESQRSFWRFVGILALIVVIVWVIGMAFMFVGFAMWAF
jgi:hypothetical protein